MQTNDIEDRQILSGVTLTVLDHGFVRVVDKMGDDAAVVQAARLSPGSGVKGAREDHELVNMLMRTRQAMPFDQCTIKLHISAPLMLMEYWQTRPCGIISDCDYSDGARLLQMYEPDPERIVAGIPDAAEAMVVQQAYSNLLGSVQSVTQQAMQYGAKSGVAPDINRINMTLGVYQQFYWTVTANQLMTWLQISLALTDNDEVIAYSQVIARILQAWMPVTYGAYMEYVYHAATFSLKEQEVMSPIAYGLYHAIMKDGAAPPATFTDIEWRAFLKKLESIGELVNENHIAERATTGG